MANSSPNLRRQSDIAHARIRKAIIRCELPPGSVETEAGLAHAFGCTRASVRSALSRLESEGLVRPTRRIGYAIKPITLREAADLLELAEILHVAAARLAAGRVDRPHLAQLNARCREGFVPTEPDSLENFLLADFEFHAAIANAAGNERLASQARQLLSEAQRLFQFAWNGRSRPGEFADDHLDLIDALAGSRAESAADIARAHVSRTRQFVLDVLHNSTAILDASIGMERLADSGRTSLDTLADLVGEGAATPATRRIAPNASST